MKLKHLTLIAMLLISISTPSYGAARDADPVTEEEPGAPGRSLFPLPPMETEDLPTQLAGARAMTKRLHEQLVASAAREAEMQEKMHALTARFTELKASAATAEAALVQQLNNLKLKAAETEKEAEKAEVRALCAAREAEVYRAAEAHRLRSQAPPSLRRAAASSTAAAGVGHGGTSSAASTSTTA